MVFIQKKDEGSQSEDTQINFDEPLTERKAKINRKEIVESEDSDKLSSEESVSPLNHRKINVHIHFLKLNVKHTRAKIRMTMSRVRRKSRKI